MSQAHIPQPDAAASAEVFDSVSDPVVQPVVSNIGIPAGPPGEIPIHTGQQNGIDPVIHRQWIPTDTIIWTTSQTAGTLIYKKPIHPDYSNSVVSYLKVLYNTWGGSLDYRFKVAGTGFHAGAVAIVRIPPNCKPEDFPTSDTWGAFEWMAIDPKTLETESVSVSDQRPIAFHYMKFREDDPYTFGGWIAMYVMIPLNTSSTGSQQIAIQSFCRPGMSFNFSQLISPRVKKDRQPFPEEALSAFDFNDGEVLTTAFLPAKQMVIEPKSVTQTFYVANCKKLNGQPMSKYIPKATSTSGFRLRLQFSGVGGNQGTSFKLYFDKEFPIVVPKGATAVVSGFMSGTSETFTKNAKLVFDEKANTNNVAWDFQDEGKLIVALQNCQAVPHDVQLADDYTDNTYSAVASGESIVHFTMANEDDRQKIKSVQTRRMTDMFSTGQLASSLFEGVAGLFVLVTKDELLPVAYLKLYSEGFFTARSTDKQIIFNLSNVQLRFSGYISRSEPLPGNAEYNKNMLLYRAASQQFALTTGNFNSFK